ncbi:putative uncharacterized protein [Tetragenococcus halophilus subsp. halophilus]|nr:putative uncharacterized protein [Tetragenococcus halophilus subsp. halophilus]GBD70012.1 putative uncharacterized protein [Tetragenococcus halophilus subsp. halophilus]GBD80244.1 putative uncharacterized protein [Tetragenococcus halophilus subsp. halophilus]
MSKRKSRDKMKEKIILKTEYMTLAQLLKELDVISSGGQAKWYLQENTIFVNGEIENHRGRKLYAGTMIEIPEIGTFFMTEKGTKDASK